MNRMAPSTALLVSGLIGLIGLGACSTVANPAPAPAASSIGDIGDLSNLSDVVGTAGRRHDDRRRRPRTTTSAGAYPTADVCTYLAAQVPALTAIGSPVGVQANLAGNLFGFFQSHGVPADGAQSSTTRPRPSVPTCGLRSSCCPV